MIDSLYKEIFHESWLKPLKDAGCLDQLDFIIPHMDVLYENTIVYPIKELVFRAFKGNYRDVRVVLLGQDPYHSVHNGVPDACGLSFVTENGYVPPSLENMFKELCNDHEAAKNVSKYNVQNYPFMEWANNGVLLLNTLLTVEAGKPNSHANIWKIWSKKLIDYLVDNRPDLVWILLGKQAERLLEKHDCRKVIAAHPSPLAGGRFFGSKVYSKANDLLTEKINW